MAGRDSVRRREQEDRAQKGHRIRLQVSSGAHPRWNRNLGTGESILTTMLVAEQTVYHDREHPSAVILPVTVSEPDSRDQF